MLARGSRKVAPFLIQWKLYARARGFPFDSLAPTCLKYLLQASMNASRESLLSFFGGSQQQERGEELTISSEERDEKSCGVVEGSRGRER